LRVELVQDFAEHALIGPFGVFVSLGSMGLIVAAIAAGVALYDEWEQASHGGELTGAVAAGLVRREQVRELGAVLTGDAPGRSGPEEMTLFDSTGLAIQDLALCLALREAHRAGRVHAETVRL
jgi:alanine dehydrogenase